jgi:hypothetical protein
VITLNETQLINRVIRQLDRKPFKILLVYIDLKNGNILITTYSFELIHVSNIQRRANEFQIVNYCCLR